MGATAFLQKPKVADKSIMALSDVAKLTNKLEHVIAGLDKVYKAQSEGKTGVSRFGKLLKPYLSEMHSVMTAVQTDKKLTEGQKLEKLHNVEASVNGLKSDMGKLTTSLKSEGEEEKESILLGVLMSRKSKSEKEQMEGLLRQSVHASVRENASDELDRIFERVHYDDHQRDIQLARTPRSARTPQRGRPNAAQARPATARRAAPGDLAGEPMFDDRSLTPRGKLPQGAAAHARLVGGVSTAVPGEEKRKFGSARTGFAPFTQMSQAPDPVAVKAPPPPAGMPPPPLSPPPPAVVPQEDEPDSYDDEDFDDESPKAGPPKPGLKADSQYTESSIPSSVHEAPVPKAPAPGSVPDSVQSSIQDPAAAKAPVKPAETTVVPEVVLAQERVSLSKFCKDALAEVRHELQMLPKGLRRG